MNKTEKNHEQIFFNLTKHKYTHARGHVNFWDFKLVYPIFCEIRYFWRFMQFKGAILGHFWSFMALFVLLFFGRGIVVSETSQFYDLEAHYHNMYWVMYTLPLFLQNLDNLKPPNSKLQNLPDINVHTYIHGACHLSNFYMSNINGLNLSQCTCAHWTLARQKFLLVDCNSNGD